MLTQLSIKTSLKTVCSQRRLHNAALDTGTVSADWRLGATGYRPMHISNVITLYCLLCVFSVFFIYFSNVLWCWQLAPLS